MPPPFRSLLPIEEVRVLVIELLDILIEDGGVEVIVRIGILRNRRGGSLRLRTRGHRILEEDATRAAPLEDDLVSEVSREFGANANRSHSDRLRQNRKRGPFAACANRVHECEKVSVDGVVGGRCHAVSISISNHPVKPLMRNVDNLWIFFVTIMAASGHDSF
jgi:hypothetical protein